MLFDRQWSLVGYLTQITDRSRSVILVILLIFFELCCLLQKRDILPQKFCALVAQTNPYYRSRAIRNMGYFARLLWMAPSATKNVIFSHKNSALSVSPTNHHYSSVLDAVSTCLAGDLQKTCYYMLAVEPQSIISVCYGGFVKTWFSTNLFFRFLFMQHQSQSSTRYFIVSQNIGNKNSQSTPGESDIYS